MKVLFLSWGRASESSSLSVPNLRRLVKARVLSPPLRLGPGRVGFDPETFEAEIRAHVAKVNEKLGPARSAPAPTVETEAR